MATSQLALTTQFDELVACTNILMPGVEGSFAKFVGTRIAVDSKLSDVSEAVKKLSAEKDALQIKLKHARSSFDHQFQQRIDAEEGKKYYEKQFSIILELLGDNKLKSLSASERRSLAMLKESNKDSFSPSLVVESSAALSLSDVSLEPADVDEDTANVRDGKKWKRRRTESVDKVESPPSKKTKVPHTPKASAPPSSEFDHAQFDENSSYSGGSGSLSPLGAIHMVPPLDKHFKRPLPDKNRRRPSQGYIKQMAQAAYLDFEEPVESTSSQKEVLDMGFAAPAPSAPPISSNRIYPLLPASSSDALASEQLDQVTPEQLTPIQVTPDQVTPDQVTPDQVTPTYGIVPASRSDFDMQRRHTFFLKTVVKLEPMICDVCNKKIKFSKNCFKCKDCRVVCHPDCKDYAVLPCIPSVPTPKKKHNTDLAAFCPHSIPRVPALVVHCINEIERRGMATVGLYRVPGSMKTIREVCERLMKGKGNPGLDKVSDIHVICSVLSGFLKSLREPILTFRLQPVFIKATECVPEENALASTLEVLAELPPANKDTLAFLILHLQRVAFHCDVNKMPISSLAKIFGPNIVGHATGHPKEFVILQDIEKQPKVMMRLLGISADYWRQYMSEKDHPEHSTSPSPASLPFSPGSYRSPATPEPRPVPESPFLGSCQSPKAGKKNGLPKAGGRGIARSKRAGKNILGSLD